MAIILILLLIVLCFSNIFVACWVSSKVKHGFWLTFLFGIGGAILAALISIYEKQNKVE